MSNKFFYVHNGLTVGGVTIDGTTSSIFTPGIIVTTSTNAGGTTSTGALVVSGGAGIGGSLYVGGAIYSSATNLVLTTATIGGYAVTSLVGGPDISISGTTGQVTVNGTGTLQSITNRGATTPNAITINNATNPSTSTNGALIISNGGGAGIAGNLMVGGQMQVWGPVTFSNAVTFSGTTTYVLSTNTVYTDNIIELHTPPTGVYTPWTYDDGKDIGFRFHYYNRTASTDSNAALVLADDTQYLEWYSAGAESSTGTFSSATYGTFKTGNIILTSASSSSGGVAGNALQITNGGIGVAGNSYIGGNLYVAGTINASITGITTTATNLALGTAGQIPIQSGAGTTSFIPTGTAGYLLQYQSGNTATWVNTTTLVVGNANNILLTPSVTNANFYLPFLSTTTGYSGVQTDVDIYYNPSSNTLYAGTFNGAHVGSGAGLTSIPNSALVNSSITVSAGNGGIGVGGSPVALGGTVTITNLGVTQFLGGTTGLTSTNQTGTVILSGTLGTANGGTNATAIGPAGALAISNGTSYQFVATATNGYVLTQGTNTATYVAQTTLSVGTATNLAGGQVGGIPYQYAAGGTGFIAIGTSNQVLVSNGTTATWQNISSLSAGLATTATDVAGGVAGNIPIQSAPGITAFIATGTVGTLLQMQANNTASFVSTTTLQVGYANNISNGSAGQIPYQTGAGATSFITNGLSGQILQSAATGTPVYVNQSTLVVGTATNVAGGAAGSLVIQSGNGQTTMLPIGLNTYVLQSNGTTATYVAPSTLTVGASTNIAGGQYGQIPMQTGPGTTVFISTANIVSGYILTWNGTTATWAAATGVTAGNATTATNLSGGLTGLIPIQAAAGVTTYIASATNGYVLLQGTNTATFTVPTVLSVGTSTNVAGGTAGQIPYQTGAGATSFVTNGLSGQILQSAASGAPIYVSQSTLAVGTATNLAGGLTGLIPIQGAAGATTYIASATVGYVLLQGTNTATFTAPSTLSVGTSTNVAGGAAGSLVIQSGAGQTTMLPIGTVGTILQSNGTTATWVSTGSLTAGIATSATNLTGGVAGFIPIQAAAGVTSYITSGTAGTVLVMGVNTATWQNTLSLTGTTASTSTNTGALQVAGGVGVGGNLNVGGNIVVYSNPIIYSDTGTVIGNTLATIDTFSLTAYRSAKYVISVSNTVTSQYQSSEVLVVHDGVTPYLQDVSVFTGAAPVMTFQVTTATGNVLLQGVGTASTNTVKVQRIYIVV